MFSDRILAWKELASKGIGDDDLGRMAGPLIASEVAALQDRDPERCEVTGVAPAIVGDVRLSLGQGRVLYTTKPSCDP